MQFISNIKATQLHHPIASRSVKPAVSHKVSDSKLIGAGWGEIT